MYNHLFTDEVANIIPAVAKKYSGGKGYVIDDLISYIGLKLATYIPRYDPDKPKQFKSYVYMIADYSARQYHYLKKRGRKKQIQTVSLNSTVRGHESELTTVVADRRVVDPGVSVATKQLVKKLFNKLSPLRKRIVQMRLEGYAAHHIANQVGVSKQCVINYYNKSINRLKNSYHQIISGKAGTKVIRQWRAVDQDRADKQMSEALAKAHDSYMRSVQTERTLTGWPELPEVQGRILNYLKTVPQAKDSEICLGVSISLQWCRDSMSILKKKGYVLKVGSQRSGTYRINPSISGEGSI
jgi:RNA polymerase sigma factor (sigma-70 family)